MANGEMVARFLSYSLSKKSGHNTIWEANVAEKIMEGPLFSVANWLLFGLSDQSNF